MTILTLLSALETLQQQHSILFEIVDLTIKSSLILVLALLAQIYFYKKSASAKSTLWIVVMSSLLLMPLYHKVLPGFAINLSIDNALFSTLTPNADNLLMAALQTGGLFPVDFVLIIVGFYLTISCLMLAYLCIGIFRVWLHTKRAAPLCDNRISSILQQLMQANGVSMSVELLVATHCASPLTWGIVRHRILLPAAAKKWNDALLRQILSHELAHIQRNDWLCYIVSRTVVCLYWLNPMIWFVHRQLIMESEKACDDSVVDDTGSPVCYAENLLHLASCMHRDYRLSAVALLGKKSALSERIHYLLKPRLQPQHCERSSNVFPGLIVSALLVAPFSSASISLQLIEPEQLEAFSIQVNFVPKDSLEYEQFMRELGRV